MSIFVLNTASMLGLGVAIDYSLFMVHRFRQELELGRDVETAVAHTVATSGRAILVSAMVVTVGFYALTLSGVQMLRSLGIGGSIVTAVSLLVALTLMPAVLAFLGPRINLLPVVPRRLSTRRLWRKHSLWVMQRPIPIIGVVATIILVLGLPAFHLRVGIPGPQTLPASVDSRYGNDLLDRHLATPTSRRCSSWSSGMLEHLRRHTRALPSRFSIGSAPPKRSRESHPSRFRTRLDKFDRVRIC